MAVYWLTFRLHEDQSYAQRYDNLVDAIDKLSTKWWTQSSSFILFESATNIDGVAAAAKQAVKPTTDIVLIGMPDYKSARVIGSANQTLFDLMSFTKKA